MGPARPAARDGADAGARWPATARSTFRYPPIEVLATVTFDAREIGADAARARAATPRSRSRSIGVGYRINRPFPDGEITGEMILQAVEELVAEPVTRVIIRDPHSTSEDEFVELAEKLGLHGTNYFIGWTAWLDIAPEGVSKASALADVADASSASTRQDVLAIGDGRNDIEMLQWAGRGVAMGQSPLEVQDAADDVTGDRGQRTGSPSSSPAGSEPSGVAPPGRSVGRRRDRLSRCSSSSPPTSTARCYTVTAPSRRAPERCWRRSRQRGVHVVFVTGRPIRWMDGPLGARRRPRSRDVLQRGHRVRRPRRGPWRWPAPSTQRPRWRSDGCCASSARHRRSRWSGPTASPGSRRFMPRIPAPPDLPVGPLSEIVDDRTVKMLARHEDLDPEKFWAEVDALVGDLVTTTWSSTGALVEISAAGVTQGDARSRSAAPSAA